MSRTNGNGGMQTSAVHNTLICPKCNKPAFRKESGKSFETWLHFAKNGTVAHTLVDGEWFTRRASAI